MKRLLLAPALALILITLFMGSAHATCGGGALLINPHGSYYPLPIMLSSPATFTIESVNITLGFFPNIVLVMTKASFLGLTGPVTVEWTGSSQYNQTTFPKSTFLAATTGYIPDQMTTNFDTGRYNVSYLKQHLAVNGTQDDTLYYNFGPFLGGDTIGTVPRQFTVTVPSTNTRVLVLAVARAGLCAPFFNMRVGPSAPGFIVPETGTLYLTAASFTAIGLYAAIRRKPHHTSA